MNKWLKNISFSLWGKIAAMIFLVLLDVFAARLLGVDGYAEWVYFFAILTMLFYLGWFGVNTATKVFISKSLNEREKANTIIASVILRVIVSITTIVMISIIMPKVAEYLGYPQKYPNLKWLLGFAGLLVFFNSFTEYFKELFMGMNKFKNLFVITVLEYSGYFLFSVVGLWLFKNIKYIAYGYAISGFLVAVYGWIILGKKFKSIVSIEKNGIWIRLSSIFKYALPMALISLGGLILVEMDTFMLGLLSTKEDVAVYSIAKNLCQKATHVNYALTVGVMTSFAVITLDNYKEKRKAFSKATKMNLLITGIIAVCFLLFADLAIELLYGEVYGKASVLLRCLTIYYSLYGISNFFSSFLDFRGKAGFRSICYLSIIIINLGLNFAWIPKYGAIGAAIATDLSLVPYTIAVIIMSKRVWIKNSEKIRIKGGY